MTELEALAKDCIENHTHRLVDNPSKQDIYLREESIFIQGFRQSEKRIEELEKKNAELKSIADFQTSSNMDRYFQLKRSKERLAKTKELLKKIEKIVYSGENEIKRLSKIVDILAEAEQFLSEEQ